MKAHCDATKASSLAAKKLFEASPLPKIGSDIWGALWEAIRDFSDGVAYPARQFPEATADKNLCVLCQQTLDDEAVQRLATSEDFVKSTTKTTEQTCLNTRDDRMKELAASAISADSLAVAFTFLNEELSLPDVAGKVSAWVDAAGAKLTSMLNWPWKLGLLHGEERRQLILRTANTMYRYLHVVGT